LKRDEFAWIGKDLQARGVVLRSVLFLSSAASTVLDNSTEIEKELPIMEKVVGAFYENAKAGNAQVNVNEIVKILEAQKK
jgi:hypothetical protein